MKKTLSLILALTLAMALAVPAMAAAEYGKVTATYVGNPIVFDSAIEEKKMVTVIERNDQYEFVEVAYENATLITVKPGSAVDSEIGAYGYGYYLDENGSYHLIENHMLRFSAGSNSIEDWFAPEELGGIAGAPERLNMIRIYGQGDATFVVLEGDAPPASAPLADGFGEVSLLYSAMSGLEAHVTFSAAKVEFADVAIDESSFLNAMLITVQPGSIFSTTNASGGGMPLPAPQFSGTGFAVGDDGKLHSVATVSIGKLEGNLDDLFGDAKGAYYFGEKSVSASFLRMA